MPLVAEAGTLVVLWAAYGGTGTAVLPSGTMGIAASALLAFVLGTILAKVGGFIAAIVRRVGILRTADRVLGLPLGALTALFTIYIALFALVTVDGLLGPLHAGTPLGPKDVAALQTMLQANPQMAPVADPAMLQTLAVSASRAAVPKEQLAKFDQTLALYEEDVRPQLLSSRLAPLILSVGEELPVIGHHVDYPTK